MSVYIQFLIPKILYQITSCSIPKTILQQELVPHSHDFSTMALYSGTTQASPSCSCLPLTISTFFLSFLIIIGSTCVVAVLVHAGLYLHGIKTTTQRNASKTEESEEEVLDRQYGKRFNKLIWEMKAVVDMGDRLPIPDSYWPGFGAKEHVLFCLKHLHRLGEDGKFPPREELGSRTRLRIVEVIDGVEP